MGMITLLRLYQGGLSPRWINDVLSSIAAGSQKFFGPWSCEIQEYCLFQSNSTSPRSRNILHQISCQSSDGLSRWVIHQSQTRAMLGSVFTDINLQKDGTYLYVRDTVKWNWYQDISVSIRLANWNLDENWRCWAHRLMLYRHYWFPFKWWWTTNRRMNNDSWFRDAIIQVYKVLFKCNFFQVEGRGSDSCCTHANPLMQDGGLIKADSCDLTAASLVWICMCLGNGVVMSTSMMKGCRAISV